MGSVCGDNEPFPGLPSLPRIIIFTLIKSLASVSSRGSFPTAVGHTVCPWWPLVATLLSLFPLLQIPVAEEPWEEELLAH